MTTIGVGVEGPSDRLFWNKYLHRSFKGRRFDVRNMNNRPKLIRQTVALLEMFRDLHYTAGMIILDRDKEPCVQRIRDMFEQSVQSEFHKPLHERFLFLIVAVRKLESWFLADHEAVTTLLPRVDYEMPEDTSQWGVGRLEELWKRQYGRNAAYNKIDFAQRMASKFSETRAMPNSESLRIGWERIRRAVQREEER